MKGYTLIEEKYVAEIRSTAYIYRHDKTGANVLYLYNPDDDNKVFCISFCTPPEDNCGTPHILEHTVLCGSDQFPLKDPFMQLGKGSLNTFLNAMTYPDKTMYPVASQNDKDFMTLMDVYLDAVFHPFIKHSKKPLMQEGWHYVPSEDHSTVSVQGVVYNEMKGAFSSSEEVLSREIKRWLNPDNAYQYESGGIPDEIPDLTYERYLDFYDRHYQPANSYIFFYGNGDQEAHLSFLDEHYLAEMDDSGLTYHIEPQKPFEEPLFKEEVYASSDEEDKPYFSYSLSYGAVTDPLTYYTMDILEYILLEAEGAPLKEALQKEHFGDDIFGFVDNSLLNPIFSIIVKGADPDKEAMFVPAVRRICEQIIEKGFSKEMIEGAINSAEFRLREAETGGAPKGLVYLITAMLTWLHGESPIRHLEYNDVFLEIREKAKHGFFEDLLKKMVLDNTHALCLTMKPDQEWNERRDLRNQELWDQYYASLSEEEKEILIREDEELKAFQQTPETEEALRSIPLLELSDIDPKAETYPLIEKSTHGVKTLIYPGFTNGIVYLKLLFDLNSVEVADYPYLTLLTEILGSMNTAHKSYEELGNAENIHTGGIGMSVRTTAETQDGYDIYYQIIGKCFYHELPKMLDLIREQLLETDFSDTDRLKDLLSQTLSRLEMQMPGMGHNIAVNRARANTSRTAAAAERLNGTIYYEVLSDLVSHFDEKKEELIQNLQKLLQRFVTKNGLMIHITAEEEEEQKLRAMISPWIMELPSVVEKPLSAPKAELLTGRVGLLSSSMVQYVASVGSFSRPYDGRMFVLRSILSQDYLWDQIRVLGGAYGCMTAFNRRGQWYIVSYRDPNLERTLDVYAKIPEYVRSFQADEREMTKYIIGTISDLSQPLSVSLKGARSLDIYLNHLDPNDTQRIRNEVLGTTIEDIHGMADMMQGILDSANICVFGNAARLKDAEEIFDELKELV